MKVLRKELKFRSRSTEVQLFPLGDIHFLKANHCGRQLKKVMERIANTPNAYIVDMGDDADYISTSDKRFKASAIPDELLVGTAAQIKARLGDIYKYSTDQFIDYMMPYADRFLIGLRGNHEDKVYLHHHFDVQTYKCEKLGITDGGLSCFLNLVMDRGPSATLCRLFLKHKPPGGSGRTAGAKYNALQKMVNQVDVDIVITAHTHGSCHEIFVRDTTTMGENPRHVKKKVYAVNTGSFTETRKEGVETYEEEANYPSNPIVVQIIKIRPFTKEGMLIDIEPWQVR